MIIAGDMSLYFGVMILTLIIGGGAQLYVQASSESTAMFPARTE